MRTLISVLAVSALAIGGWGVPPVARAQSEADTSSISAGQCFSREDAASRFLGSSDYDVVLRWNGTESELHRSILRHRTQGFWVMFVQTPATPTTFCISGVGRSISNPQRFLDYSRFSVACDQQVQQMKWRPFEFGGRAGSASEWDHNTARTLGRIDTLAQENGWDSAMRARQVAAMQEFRASLGIPRASYCESQGAIPLSQMLRSIFPNGQSGMMVDAEVMQMLGQPEAERLLVVHGPSEGQVIGSPVWAFVLRGNGQTEVLFGGIRAAEGRPPQ